LRRRALLGRAVAAGAAVAMQQVSAQPAGRVPRIGVLRWGASGDEAHLGLTAALRVLGYREGQTVAIEWRFTTRKDQAQAYAAELVAMNPDLLVGSATPAVEVLRDATRSVPIIMASAADPVAAGLVASLPRPGGNITGVSGNLTGVVPKQMQLLREALPGLQRVAFLGSTDDVATKLFVEQAQAGARTLGIRLQAVLISQAREFEAAVDSMQRERAQGVLVQPLFTLSQAAPLAAILQQRQLPSVSALRNFVVGGGLMSYGPKRADVWRRAASMIDRVLKGARPDSLPVEEPTTFELLFNLGTARALGMKIPQKLLLRADEVIE
jgi:putative tryptophan/tyrosine transport system substrate-binding protein